VPIPVLAAVLGLALGQAQWQAGFHGESLAYHDGAGDLELAPRLAVEYDRRLGGPRDLLLQAGYDPALTLREPRGRGTFSALHNAHATAALQLDRNTRLTATQTLAIGSTNLGWASQSFSAVPSTAARSIQSASIRTTNETTALSLQESVSRDLVLNGDASYGIAGGSTAIAELELPRTRALHLGGGGAWVGRRDSIGVSAGWSRVWASAGASRTSSSLDGYASWRHALTGASQRALAGEPVPRMGERTGPRYETELTAGASQVRGDPTLRRTVVPTVSASLRRDEPGLRPGALGAHVTVRYAPVLNQATGTLTPRGEASAEVSVRLARQLVALAGGGGGRVFDTKAPAQTFAQGGASLQWEASRYVSLTLGARVAHTAGTEWAGFAGATWSQTGRL
jgi:hypothetical protein